MIRQPLITPFLRKPYKLLYTLGALYYHIAIVSGNLTTL